MGRITICVIIPLILLPACSRKQPQARPEPILTELDRAPRKDQPKAAQADDVKKDLEALQGTWKVVLWDKGDGQPRQMLELPLIIRGDRMTHVSKVQPSLECTIRIDPTKTPKWIDMEVIAGAANPKAPKRGADRVVVVPGVYAISGNTLRICLPQGVDQQRPTGFRVGPGKGWALMTAERERH
jgi:uncharacterized protein (TIGR03067 family)